MLEDARIPLVDPLIFEEESLKKEKDQEEKQKEKRVIITEISPENEFAIEI